MNRVGTATSSPAHARAMLVGLLLLFAAPLLIATVLYGFRDWVSLPPPDSHGDLIVPAHPFKRFDLVTLNRKPLDIEFLRGKWTLVYVGDRRCDLWCEASLFKMRQVRLALGRDQTRVQRLYVVTDNQALTHLRPLLRRHSGMKVAQPLEGSRRAVLDPFGAHPSGTFFLIDPHANLMMRYPPNATARGLKEDLEHLLEVSRIG